MTTLGSRRSNPPTTVGWSLINRTPFIVDVIRDRNNIYREVGDDRIENVYQIKIMNQTERE